MKDEFNLEYIPRPDPANITSPWVALCDGGPVPMSTEEYNQLLLTKENEVQ